MLGLSFLNWHFTCLGPLLPSSFWWTERCVQEWNPFFYPSSLFAWLWPQIAFPPIAICPVPPLSPRAHANSLEIAGPTARWLVLSKLLNMLTTKDSGQCDSSESPHWPLPSQLFDSSTPLTTQENMMARVPQGNKTSKTSISYTMQQDAFKLRLVGTSHHLRNTFDQNYFAV